MSNLKRQSNNITLFEGNEIRRVVLDGELYYSLEDVVVALTDSRDPKAYIQKLKQRDEELNKGWGQFVHTLPMKTTGGIQQVNCATNEGLFRIIPSISSKKAEPFKRWLARVEKERLDEIEQPSKAIERAKWYYIAKGYSPEWVQTRIAGIDTGHTFTDSFKESGIKDGFEYAILTDELYLYSIGLNSRDYKIYKGLSKHDSLIDNMTSLEIASTIFSEATSTEIITKTQPQGFIETKNAIHIAGKITNEAIKKIEKATGKKVVTHKNAKELDSPEIRKELAQSTLKEEKKLGDFDETLKEILKVPPSKKEKDDDDDDDKGLDSKL